MIWGFRVWCVDLVLLVDAVVQRIGVTTKEVSRNGVSNIDDSVITVSRIEELKLIGVIVLTLTCVGVARVTSLTRVLIGEG